MNAHVVIRLKQRMKDAEKIRAWLKDYAPLLPKNMLNAEIRVWMEHVATQIEDQVKRQGKVVQFQPRRPEPPRVA